MQALIITCLLCLQTPNPCDLNPTQTFSEEVDCSKCETYLHDYFNLPVDNISSITSTESGRTLAKSAEDSISSELSGNLEFLLSDAEDIIENMRQNPDELHDMMKKMKIEINKSLIPGTQSHKTGSDPPTKAETLKKVQKQEHLLKKINEKFGDLFDQSATLKEKFKVMRGILSLENPEEETKERRDTVRFGERLMIGEELVSKNGKWRFMLDPKTGEYVLFDRKGNEIMRTLNCDFPKPLSPNIHMLMNHGVEYYLDIENGKSKNIYCFSGSPPACSEENIQCYLKLDNDGHLKIFFPSGEPYFTYY